MGLIQGQQKQQGSATISFSQVASNELLLVFTRTPVPGKCKTRLAKIIGDVPALEVYAKLLERTMEATQDLPVAKWVLYSDDIVEDDIWDPAFYIKKKQSGKNLGDRMANAFLDGFEAGYAHIVIIGSDLWDLNPKDIREAFEALRDKDFVLGPASDGGYYLLGMNVYQDDVFQDMEWGSATVCNRTLVRLGIQNTYLLPEKNDIDTYEDLQKVPGLKRYLI